MSNGSSAFDPEAFIDRIAEQELFDGVLTFKGDARVITIRDDADKGKSELLRLLHYKCQYATKTAVCLVALDELDRVHATVRYMVRELEPYGLEFAGFKDVEKRRLDGPTPTAHIQAEGSVGAGTISGGNVTGMRVDAMYVNAGGVDPDKQEELREEAVSAFVDDLRALATEQPVVLLFDAYETCSKELEQWLPRFLEKRVFDPKARAHQLVVVIAGQTVPTATLKLLLGPRYNGVVTSVEQLSLWDPEHVAAFLDRHGFKGQYDEEDVSWICAKLKKGWTIGKAMDALKAAVEVA